MKIKKITSMSGLHFGADIECEFCGYMGKITAGYNDNNFHDNVIPVIKCVGCNRSTSNN